MDENAIPEDERWKAYDLLTKLSDDREPNTQADVAVIYAAMLAERKAERERCALIAEMHDHRGDIAAAIRSGVEDGRG